MPHDLDRVKRVMDLLDRHGIVTWLFGGWAEELHGLVDPRPHGDIDLLYPADDLSVVDRLLTRGAVAEIAAKRLPHKRAFVFEGTMTEILLVHPDLTTMFRDERRHTWPADVFEVGTTRVASTAALAGYRTAHARLHGHCGARAGADDVEKPVGHP